MPSTGVRSHARRGTRGVRSHTRNLYYSWAQGRLPDLTEDLDDFIATNFSGPGRTPRDREVAREAAAYMRGRIEAQLGRFEL